LVSMRLKSRYWPCSPNHRRRITDTLERSLRREPKRGLLFHRCIADRRRTAAGKRRHLLDPIGRWSGVEQGSCRLPCFAATPGTVKSFTETARGADTRRPNHLPVWVCVDTWARFIS
jgi:hypothetical protein